ncbi:hypothetical protein SDC9_146847 [bioreactor metagenome]|uniref:Uncharacterized protein n=1 Tax=bioreactor metagenome TaxID=1076179 RepID=A0A645EC90_9ZZZZ
MADIGWNYHSPFRHFGTNKLFRTAFGGGHRPHLRGRFAAQSAGQLRIAGHISTPWNLLIYHKKRTKQSPAAKKIGGRSSGRLKPKVISTSYG